MTHPRLMRLIVIGVTLTTAAVSASEPTTEPQKFSYSFSFGSIGEDKDIEILNYKYSRAKASIVQPPGWSLATGHIGQGDNRYDYMPIGDSLYVKWRVLSTGKVYEDTVDLRNKLPSEMENKVFHFAINGSRLLVYVIENRVMGQVHAREAPDCPPPVYKPYKCSRVYPDHWSNF